MTDDNLKNLLQQADRLAGRPESIKVDITAIRKKAKRRKIINIASPVAAAAVLFFGVSFLVLQTHDTKPIEKRKNIMVSIGTSLVTNLTKAAIKLKANAAHEARIIVSLGLNLLFMIN